MRLQNSRKPQRMNHPGVPAMREVLSDRSKHPGNKRSWYARHYLSFPVSPAKLELPVCLQSIQEPTKTILQSVSRHHSRIPTMPAAPWHPLNDPAREPDIFEFRDRFLLIV